MSAHPHEKRVYQSARPPATGVGVVRLPIHVDRASKIIACCDAVELQHFIHSVLQVGYVACVTRTSDGGAVSLTVFDGDIRYKSWARSEDELLICYRDLLAAIGGEE